MSPGITWRDGGPLMVGGQIGGSERCCCETPPPPLECWCPDACSFDVAITAPTRLAASLQAPDCESLGFLGFRSDSSFVEEFVFGSVSPPFGFTPQDFGTSVGPKWRNSSYSEVSAGLWSYNGLQARVEYQQLYENQSFTLSGYSFPYLVVNLEARAEVACDDQRTDGSNPPNWTAAGLFTLRLAFLDRLDGLVFATQSRSRFQEKRTVAAVNSSCFIDTKRSCGLPDQPSGDRRQFLATPLTFDVSGNSISLDHSVVSERSYSDFTGAQEATLATFSQDLIDAAESITVRITSRPSCQTIPADCEVPIEGRVVYFPQDGVAVYGYEFGTPKTDVYDFGAWEFAHDGVANGTAESPYVFNAKKFAENPAGFILEEHNLEVFCALDDTVTPPVSRWYVRELVYCTPEFGRQTTDQWISEIPSYPEPARDVPCEGVNAGDPVPVGSPSYQRVDGYPIVDFGDPCDPPPPIGLQITGGCS